MRQHGKWLMLITLLFALLMGLLSETAVTQASPTAATGVIAYAGLSNDGRAVSVKTIQPDGGNPQTLYTTSQFGDISDIAWSPNAQEIAFIDKSEAPYSLFNQDIFALNPVNNAVRRLSNPPRFTGLPAGYQTGTVQGTLRNNSGRTNVSLISIYVQGATSGAQGTFINHLDTVSFNLNVADLGNGTMQYLVIVWSDSFGGPYREIIPAVVDVLPGQSVNLGTLDFVGQTFQPNISDLSWNHNGTLAGVILENGATSPWQFMASGEATGSQMLDPGGSISALALSPTDNRVAYWRATGAEGVIALNQIGGSALTEEIIINDQQASLNYDRHIAWLPDGSGMVISANGEIFDYIIATHQVRQLTSFNGAAQVDRVTVSPDGNVIAFSYSTTPGTSDIYLLNRQTFAFTQLTTDGRSAFPSWSRVDPVSSQKVYLPMVIR